MQRALHSSSHTVSSFDGTTICYETTPGDSEKPTLLFIHGMGGNLTAWDRERAYFQSLGFPTVAIDLRGHGLSERPHTSHAYELSHYAQDVIAVMNTQKAQYIILGHCFGGMIALMLAGQLHVPMKALILIDTSYKAPNFSQKVASHTLSKILMAALTNIPFTIGLPGYTNYQPFINTSDFDPRRIFFDIWHTSLQSYLYTSKSLLSFQGESLLPRIRVSTLIIEGTQDAIFPPIVAKHLAERIKHSQLEFIPGANHIIVLNHSKEINNTIKVFLERL